MREADNIRDVEALGIDWMGFIFFERSSRHVGARPAYLPERCKRVGVFVNSSEDFILDRAKDFALDVVQLHGDESAAFCQQLRMTLPAPAKLVKMVSVGDAGDFRSTTAYAPYVDYFLFESPCIGYGGSGRKFDWTLLEAYKGDVPFILTGGIGPDDAAEILSLSHPRFAGIDLNSRFEDAPALKNPGKLKSFIGAIRLHEQKP